MTTPTLHLRRMLTALTVSLVATCLPGAGPAQARPVAPLEHADGDSVVLIEASSTLQLLKGPGITAKQSKAPASAPQRVGKKATGKPVVSRLLYSFDLSGVPADAITEVVLEHWQIYSPNRTCYLDSYGPAVKVVGTAAPAAKPQWPGPKATSAPVASGFAVGSRRACVPDHTQTWDLTDIVRAAAQQSPTVHLRLASADETRRSGYRKYDGKPTLRVFVRARPDRPTNLTVTPLTSGSPDGFQVTSSSTPRMQADLTTPGGCPGSTSLSTCLAARYELADADGTVVASGEQNPVSEVDGVGRMNVQVGPLSPGEDYALTVWGVNTSTGLESSDPGTATIRYAAAPEAPEVTLPDPLRMGQPIVATVTTHVVDAKQVCWNVLNAGPALTGCADLAPDAATEITLGTINNPGSISGYVWIVDGQGTQGASTRVQGVVTF